MFEVCNKWPVQSLDAGGNASFQPASLRPQRRTAAWAAALLSLFLSCPAGSAVDDDVRKELEALRQEISALRREKSISKAPIETTAAKVVENKYGPNASVATKQGKLTIGGLLQVWYHSIQNDNLGYFGNINVPAGAVGGGDTNEGNDNDTFRIRRAEIKFTMDITEHIQAVVMLDPARPAAGFPTANTNLGGAKRSITASVPGNIQSGDFTAGARLFQDGYILYHRFVPHHNFQIGQFKPPVGEEGIRSSSALDFAERSLLGQLGDKRDLGLTVHGTWWEDRFQYWFGLFNNAGNLHGSSGSDQQNRADDNDEKDLVYRLLLRPVWKNETWGDLELGWSSQYGVHGEAGDSNKRAGATIDGLNREPTDAVRHYAWAAYMPGGPVKGWWMRGEYAYIKDRNAPAAVSGFNNTFSTSATSTFGRLTTPTAQNNPNPFSVEGFYVATGYQISKSIFKDKVPKWFQPFEFTFRYEQFENVTTSDLISPNIKTDTFASDVYTAGFNYYIKGHNAKIQANYHWAGEPNRDMGVRKVREVRNDSLIVAFQVAW